MKKLLLIWFFIAINFVISCTQKGTSNLFDKVERYMEIYPDSALSFLQQIPHPESLEGKQQADYALLLTKARDKNYLDSLQSDSLIKIAVDYYRSTEDKVKEGEALFYYGKVMALQDSVTVAMNAYLDAEIVLENTEEYKTLALLNEYIGYLNYDRDVYKDAVNRYRKSIYYNSLINDTLKMVYEYRNIARVYIAKQDNDSARWSIENGIALLNGDSTLQVFPSLLQILGIVERNQGHYSNAISNFLQAIKYERDIHTSNYYYQSLGSLYMQIGKLGQAEECFKKGVKSSQLFTQAGAYNCLFLLEKKKENYAQALLYKERSDSLLSITQNEDLRTQILTLQQKFERDKLIMINKQLKQKKQIQFYSMSFIILLVAVVSSVSIFTLRKVYRKRFKKDLRIIRDNEVIIKKYIYQIDELKLNENQRIESNKERIGKLNQKILLLTNENKAIRENICVSAVFLLDQLKRRELIVKRMSKKEKAQVFEYVDLLFGNFLSRIRKEYELTENNLMLIALLKIGFSSKELMFVFDCEMNSVFRMKQRLRERLHLTNDNNLEEYITLY